MEQSERGIGWQRSGSRAAYFENQYETESGVQYYTLTFTITFPEKDDVCTRSLCFSIEQRCPPRQKSRVERLKAKVEPLST